MRQLSFKRHRFPTQHQMVMTEDEDFTDVDEPVAEFLGRRT
jgi:hypothetical protein